VGSALDVGCGTGDLSRLLAARADRVRALDLSANMIRVAKGRCASSPNIDFEIADVMTCALEPASFDCIASIATLHHLPMQPVLERLRDALRPGGVLMVLDLFTPASVADRLAWAASYPLNVLIRLRHGYRPPSRDARKVWNEHGRRDVYPRLRDVRALCAAYLPGADVRRHLLWRYSIVWRKPGVSGTG
jgi:2-polyprenyl-3-methyl-5-hydroxy-6-metoxy-1,4-benzoquinol methylase